MTYANLVSRLGEIGVKEGGAQPSQQGCAGEIYSGVLPAMSRSTWRSNIAVGCGVVGGILVSVWFSVVVAMGPAPGWGQQTDQSKPAQGDQSDGARKHEPRAIAKETQKRAQKESECSNEGQGSYYDCLIQLRTARATEIQAHYAWVAAWVSGFALAAASIAAASGIWTVYVMRRSSMTELRAYVSAKPGNVEFSGRIPMILHLEAKNTGQTPAYNVVMLGRFVFLPHPLPEDFDFGPDPPRVETTNVLAAGDVFPGTRPLGRPMGETRETQLLEGTHRWYAIGIVRYRDAFGHHRTTRFCASSPGDLMLEVMLRSSSHVATKWEYTNKHNDAD